MAGPSLGTNLSGLEDWSPSYPFVNQFLMTRGWFTQSDTEWDSGDAALLDLDAGGWVRGFTQDDAAAPFRNLGTIWQTNGEVFRPGTYVLDWQGTGDVRISGATVLTQQDGRITFRLNGPDAGLVARFESSNEVWNWGFGQAQWAQARAVAAWGADVEGGWMQWYGRQVTTTALIVADVFGAETGTRALNVFATQSGWQGLEGDDALDAPERVADGGMAPRDAPIHVHAIAPYFSGGVGSVDNAALVDQWITMGEAGFVAAIDVVRSGPDFDSLANIGSTIAYHAGVAASPGWTLEAHEAGQHIVDLAGLFGGAEDRARTAFFIDLVRRPAFHALYTEYFEIWRANGGGLMANFFDFGPPSRDGSWGIRDSVWSPDSPRAVAVQVWRDTEQAWWADARPASTFDDGVTLIDRTGRNVLNGGALEDALFGLGGADRMAGHGGDDLMHGGAGGGTSGCWVVRGLMCWRAGAAMTG